MKLSEESTILMLKTIFMQQYDTNSLHTEEELDAIINDFKSIAVGLKVSDASWSSFVSEIKRHISVKVVVGDSITDGKAVPWVRDFWKDSNRYYWRRFEIFKKASLPVAVIKDIDAVTDDILDQCGNPNDCSQPWQKRGLVIGDVQSGKTGVFTGLINKASDAGYKVIIVLTGVLESLRRQTQERLNTDYVGHAGGNNVSIVNSDRMPFTLTSVEADFNKRVKSNVDFSFNSHKEPVLFVSKKNVSVLEAIIKWLKKTNMKGQYVHAPLLLIDDEADNASVNTRKEDEDPTAVNHKIRDLLALFKNATYVGFTATPFANVFINPDYVEGVAEDLFPRNFIWTTSIPDNYFSVQRMLGVDDIKDESDFVNSPYLCRIADASTVLPLKHKKTQKITRIWSSLAEAIHQYILANAILDLRKRNQHRSMLINATRFTTVQKELAERVEEYFDQICEQLIHVKSPGADRNPTIALLKRCFEQHYSGCEFSWEQIKTALPDAVKGVRVYVVNSSKEAKQRPLDYSVSKVGVRAIVVGGLGVARGVTIEGLCVSYLYRTTAMYDTLMQMGRWFGYRDGYADLCRVWMTDQTLNYYSQIGRATAELKVQISKMRQSKRTPLDFGLKVRASPDALLITSRNKMRTSKEVTLRVQYSSYFVESTQLRVSDNDQNLQTLKHLLSAIVEDKKVTQQRTETGNRILFRGVSKELVASFVEQFKVDPYCYQLYGFEEDSSPMAEFIRRNTIPKLQEWDILIYDWSKPPADRSKTLRLDLGGEIKICCLRRHLSDIESLDNGKVVFERGRIAGKEAEVGPLSKAEIAKIKAVSAKNKELEAGNRIGERVLYREKRNRPLLILMPVALYAHAPEGEKDFNEGLLLSEDPIVAYGLSFCNFDASGDLAQNYHNIVSYKVNKTWVREYLDPEPDEDDEEEE